MVKRKMTCAVFSAALLVVVACTQTEAFGSEKKQGSVSVAASPSIMLPWSPLREFDDENFNEDLQVEVLPGLDLVKAHYSSKSDFRHEPGCDIVSGQFQVQTK